MRVLYVNPDLTRLDSESGTWGRQVVQELRDAGAEVNTFPAASIENTPLAKNPGGWAGRIKGFVKAYFARPWTLLFIEYYMLVRGIKRTVRGCWRIWRHRRQLCPDVVLARTFEYEWTPWLVARALKRPFVLEVHAPFYVERQVRGRRYSRLLRWFERVQWRRAERVWVNSRELESIIIENGVAPGRICCIPHGVRMDRFPKQKSRHANGPLQIIFVGSFYPWHGVEPLLKAFSMAQARVGGLRLCLVGDGIARPVCEEQVRSLGIKDTVEFTGWLAYEKVIEYLNKADIGVAPFLKLEPFYFDPVKIVEYMAAGLAIVASELGRISEMLGHGKEGLLVPPGETSALADALVELAEDSALRERLGEAARAKIAHASNWPQRVLALCEEAVTLPPLSSA